MMEILYVIAALVGLTVGRFAWLYLTRKRRARSLQRLADELFPEAERVIPKIEPVFFAFKAAIALPRADGKTATVVVTKLLSYTGMSGFLNGIKGGWALKESDDGGPREDGKPPEQTGAYL